MDREKAMKPRVLVVEDDPVSLAFFVEVLAGLPAAVDAATGCDEAEARARDCDHALWLVDAHLPDGDAVSLLPRLRAHDAGAIALAHTASREAGLHEALRAAGYVDVLVKPVPVATLLSTVGGRLRLHVREPRAAFGSAPVVCERSHDPRATSGWDEDAALAALDGRPAHVEALRALFVAELPATVAKVEVALRDGDAAAARDLLHRLAAACAFTGALGLAAAVRALHRDPADRAAAEAFRRAAAKLS